MMQNMLKDKKRNAHAQPNRLVGSTAVSRTSNLRYSGNLENGPDPDTAVPVANEDVQNCNDDAKDAERRGKHSAAKQPVCDNSVATARRKALFAIVA